MKTITFVIGSLGVGGAEKHLSILAPQLVNAGYKVTIITLSNNDLTLASELIAKNVIIVAGPKYCKNKFYKPMAIIRILFFLISQLRLEQHIVHFFLPEAYIMGMLAMCFLKSPAKKIMSRRSLNYYQHKKPLIKIIEKILHQKVDYILGNSNAVIEQLRQEENVSLEKLFLIYNGISYPEKTVVDRALKPNKKLIFVIIANLIPYKGHKDLLHAVKLFKNKYADLFTVQCIGEVRNKQYFQELQGLAAELDISANLEWCGSVAKPEGLLQQADIGLLVSHEEGFSNAILECMFYNLPMIVTDVGGNKEAVIDNECGFVVPARAPEILAERMLKLACNAELRTEFGANARKKIVENFSLAACVEHYLNFYERLCVA